MTDFLIKTSTTTSLISRNRHFNLKYRRFFVLAVLWIISGEVIARAVKKNMAAFCLRLNLAIEVNRHFLENERSDLSIFFFCFELSNKISLSKKRTNYQCRKRNNRRKCEFSKQS